MYFDIFLDSCLFLYLLEVCLEPYFPNGHIATVVNTTYTPGDSVDVICDTGFKAESLITTCNSSMFWNPQPVCTEVVCPLPDIDNGKFTTSSAIMNQNGHVTPDIEDTTRPDEPDDFTTKTDFTYNTAVFLECNDGYKSNGPTSFTCLLDGTWGQQTSACEKILCNNTADVKHEAVPSIPDLGINETGSASYNTEHFFLTNGNMVMECQVSGKLQWMKKPTFGK